MRLTRELWSCFPAKPGPKPFYCALSATAARCVRIAPKSAVNCANSTPWVFLMPIGTLELLSSETGAKTFLLRTIGDGSAMREDCAQISRELREQYTLGFLDADPSRGGYRNVRVDVPAHPEYKIRVRKGVEVGGTESASAEP